MGNNNNNNKFQSFLLGFLFVSSNIMVLAQAGRETPKKVDAKLNPDSFIDGDGSYLVPGVGRFMLPRPGQDPFNYNPITGNSGGGLGGTGFGDNSAGASHQYIPGGDDTVVNNPGFEIPIPGVAGGIP
ncbi:putative cell wall protein [Impatiens glandulifera]|uniref:putative cell wall protein n=1 Tax=Impatiens glandulifera TaxID=253017 RepID=UPI001FB04BD2|nr:putative cell wall protein [Impatiens glandulifera]